MQLPKSTGRFTLEARIGGGAMGEVFRAVERKTGERVAIKLLRSGASKDEIARFRREIAVLADLRHPNVVQYVAHGTWGDGRNFLAMEWLEGEDLQGRSRRDPLGMHDAVEVVRRASAALAAVHTRGVVHRDLKLSNIWLCKGKGLRVKVIDFGVVKLAAPDDYETQHGAIIGTPHYMAPEQARGERVTPRADVYGLGAVLFRLVTGRVVFPTEHVVALLGQLVLEDPPLASSVRFDVPPGLDQVIAQAIARAPEDRFPDGGELARALARVGALANDPPGKEASSSTVRRVPVAAPVEPPREATLQEPASIAPGAAERRVIATVVASLGDGQLPEPVERQLRGMLRSGDKLQEVQGRRLLVAFGVRRAEGDEVVRAARSALAIASSVPGARVAIAAGQATQKARGISADALERAAVQLDQAAAGGVRVDGAMVPLLAGRFALREDAVGAVLLHEDSAGAGTRKLLGRPTPTVGREKEIALLLGVHQEMLDESTPRAAIIVGAPGIGKSRIRYELLHRLRVMERPPEILLCRGDPMSARGNIGSLGRALRAQMGVRDGEPAREQEAKVLHYVGQRNLADPDAPQLLGEIVGVHFGDEDRPRLRAARQSPGLMQGRTRAVLEAIVRADAQRAPQVILMEDLHWADEGTLDLVGWLLGSEGLRFAAFGFARPELEERPPLWEGKNVTRLSLAPLSASASEKLVAAALPESSPEGRRVLAERAAGNALFLEELIRHAAERKDELPLTVQALIQTRLDALPPPLRVVARAASVFGRSCWTEGVSELVGRDVHVELSLLSDAEILGGSEASRISGQDEWTFRHGLVRDAVYASLLDEDSRAWHQKASTWLEAAGEEDFATLARHAQLGGDQRRAANLYARATAQAYAAGSMETVLELADKGLDAATDDALRARLLVAKALVASWVGKYELLRECAKRAITIAAPGSTQWAEASRLLASAHRDRGRQSESADVLEAALAPEVADKYDPATKSRLLAELARTLADLGRMPDARDAAERAMQLAEEAGPQREAARLRAVDARFFVIAMQGDIGELTNVCRQVVTLADAASDLPLAARGRSNLGHSLNAVGLFADASETLERAVRDAHAIRMLPLEGFAWHNLGMAMARLGNHDTAIEHQRTARRLADEMGHKRLSTATQQYEALLLAWRERPGDLTQALTLARDAQAAAEDQPSQRLTAVRVLSYVQLKRRAWDAALELSADAAPSTSASLVTEWEELVRLVRVEALLAIGDDAEADALLAEAHARIASRAGALKKPEERAGYVAAIEENRRLLVLAERRLGLLPPT